MYEEATQTFSHVGRSHGLYKQVSGLLATLKPRNNPETFERAFNHVLAWTEAANIVSSMNTEVSKAQSDILRTKHGISQSSEGITGASAALTVPDSGQVTVSSFDTLRASLTDLALQRVQKRRLRRIQLEPLPAKIWTTPQDMEQKLSRLAKRAATRQLLEDFAQLVHWDKHVTLTAVMEKWLFPGTSKQVLAAEEMPIVTSLHKAVEAHLKPSLVLDDTDLCLTVAKGLDSILDEEKLSMLATMIEMWVESEDKSIEAGMGDSLLDFIVEVERCSPVYSGDNNGNQ